MSKSPLRTAMAVVAVAAVSTLVGCAATGPDRGPVSSTPAPEATASEAPPLPSALVIAGTEVRVLDEKGTQLDSLPYSVAPASAIAFFTEMLDEEPVVETLQSPENCLQSGTFATWDDALVLGYGWRFLPEGQQFTVTARAVTAAGITLQTPSGVTVGASIAPLQEEIPTEQRHPTMDGPTGAFDRVDYDVAAGQWSEPGSQESDTLAYWGATAQAVDDAVSILHAPVNYVFLC
jgi:hypothetical protein